MALAYGLILPLFNRRGPLGLSRLNLILLLVHLQYFSDFSFVSFGPHLDTTAGQRYFLTFERRTTWSCRVDNFILADSADQSVNVRYSSFREYLGLCFMYIGLMVDQHSDSMEEDRAVSGIGSVE
jgi:hypothetical protein